MSENPEVTTKPKSGDGRIIALIVLLVLVGVGGTYGYHAYNLSLFYQSTDDAQVDGDSVTVSAEVAARVKSIHVQDNQPVKAGVDQGDAGIRVAEAGIGTAQYITSTCRREQTVNLATSLGRARQFKERNSR